jgi:hypothetical protein
MNMNITPPCGVTPPASLPVTAPLIPGMTPSVVLDLFEAYQPGRVPRAAPAAPTTETIVIEHFPSKVERIRGDVQRQLEEIIKKAKDTDLERVQITAYAPAFKEFAQPRARAALEYLESNGIPANLISTKVRGNSSSLARNWAVKIEVVGTPKPSPATDQPSIPTQPAVLV